MSESVQRVAAAAAAISGGDAGSDAGTRIDALRRLGADQTDPIRFRFIETLARRMLEFDGAPRRKLRLRLEAALAACEERLMPLQAEAEGSLAELVDGDRVPDVAGDSRGRLAALARHPALHPSIRRPDDNVGPWPDLKSLRLFGNVLSKLSADQQVFAALAGGPENAGPLNSHGLILQSLQLMREIAPDYLNRFLSYADALMWLDQAAAGRALNDKAKRPGDKAGKRRTPQRMTSMRGARA